MDYYEKLCDLLNKNPIGAPKSSAFLEILRILFTPEEAQAALGMTFVPRTVEQIAEASGISVEKTATLCESMATKGIVYSRKKNGQMGYSLLPTIPGLFEFPFMKGKHTPVHDRLAELWSKYLQEGLAREFGGSETPVMRVIPIEQTINSSSEVLHFEIVSRMLESAETYAVANCACRVSVGRCERPKETCLMFDSTARFLIDRGFAREITREEAVQTLRIAEEAGLVHTCNNSQDRLTVICNCCPCCCVILRGRTQFETHHAFANSRWHASVNPQLCTGCGTCKDQRCPIGAVDLNDGIASVDQTRCIGCGLCVSTCPGNALEMVPRKIPVSTPTTVTEMGIRVLREKGRLEDYMSLNTSKIGPK